MTTVVSPDVSEGLCRIAALPDSKILGAWLFFGFDGDQRLGNMVGAVDTGPRWPAGRPQVIS
ncbi:MAG: hypothetical protein WA888_19385 [Burkholderiaceae bacterium]